MSLTGPPSDTLEPANAKPNAASFLAQLMAAHAELLDALSDLERIARGPVPNRKLFTNTRWTLSAASLARRLLWAKILAYLLPRVDKQAAEELRRLQDEDIALLRLSTQHVAIWTTDAALAEWPAYCAASSAMRGKMAAGIEAEKRILYPLLEAVSRADL